MKFQTLVELFENSCSAYSNRECYGEKQKDGSWKFITFQEFRKLVDDARAGLAALGVQKGDRVAIVSDNRIEWAVLCFATFGLGACFVPMYEAQQPDEWAFIMNDCEAKIAIASRPAVYEKLVGIKANIPTLVATIGLELEEKNPESYRALLARGSKDPVPLTPVTESDLAEFIYTSGTTGNPKGVKLSHGNFATNVLASGSRFDFGPGDRSLSFLPWAHSFGQTAELYTFLYFGVTVAINDAVPELVNNLPVVKPSVLVAVPRIFNRIYDGVNKQMADKPAAIQKLFRAGIAAKTRLSRGEKLGLVDRGALALADKLIFTKVRQKFGGRLRFVVSGSAALSTEVAEFIDALGIDVYEGYGLTETSPVISVNYPGRRKIGSVGPAIPGVEIIIDREVTGDAVNGEIVIRGPNVMQGYHNREEENAAVFRADGALRTGDMGYVDSEGFLVLTGRIKEQYKLENGKYVVPSPLEEDLKLSPFILNVMLYGANKPHNVALVVLDVAAIEKWAAGEGLTLSDLTTEPRIKKLILSELERYSTSFKGFERPKDVVLTTVDFTVENGLLTPSLKLKRRNVLAQYGAQLEALFR